MALPKFFSALLTPLRHHNTKARRGGPVFGACCRWPWEGDLALGAAHTYCISTHAMMRTARATMETTTKAVMACFFWLAATTARRSACSQRAPTYPEWQLRKKGPSACSADRGLIPPTPAGKAGPERPKALGKAPGGPSSLCDWRQRCPQTRSCFPARAPVAWSVRHH